MRALINDAWNNAEKPQKNGPGISKLVCLGVTHGPPYMKKYMICQAVFGFIGFIIYLQWNGGLIPWFMLPKPSNLRPEDEKLSVDVLKFFPETEHDGTKVTWSHGTNSKILLDDALKGPAMMIEGDIGLKGMNTDNRQMVAVMVQPPSFDSDMTFDEWLDTVRVSRKGMKLDFLHIEAVELALQKLKSFKNELNVPVHISASVAKGPNSNAAMFAPLDQARFMRLVRTHYPKATLVLGWADAPSSEGDQQRYTWDMVMEMQDIVDQWKLKQPVSYSIRASLAKMSMPQIRWLMEMTEKSSLTVVAPKGDAVPVMDMLYVRNKLPKNRVLYDLHSELHSQFDPIKDKGMDAFNKFKGGANVHNMDQRASVVQTDNTFRGMDWNVAEGDSKQKVYLGTQTVVMQKGLLITKRQVEPKENKPIKIFGRFEFFGLDKEGATSDIGFDIFLQSSRRMRQNNDNGLKCRIDLDGTVSICKDNNDEKKMQLEGNAPCFMFMITYQLGTYVYIRVTRPKSCEHMPDTVSQGTEGVVQVDMHLKGGEGDGKYIAIRHNNEKSFVAVDQFRIET